MIAVSRPAIATPTAFLTAVVLFLVRTNVFISLATTSVVVSTIVLADLQFEFLPLFIVFAVTMFVYSFNRLADRAEDAQNLPGRTSFVQRYGPAMLAFGGLLYLVAIVIAVVENVPGAPAMVLPLLVAVLYSLVGVKRVLVVKNLVVGLAWGCLPLGVGVYYGVLWTVDILFLFVFVTVMITIAAAIFDIKDIEGDRTQGIRTLPIVLGVRRTRQFAVGATVLVSAVLAGLLLSGVLSATYALLFLFLAYVLGYSRVARPDRTALFYGFVVDGEHVFLALVLLAAEFLVPSL